MADRSVSLHLRAVVDGFKRSMRDAQDSVKGVGDESEKQSKRTTASMQRTRNAQEEIERATEQALAEGVRREKARAQERSEALRVLGTAAVAVGAAAAVGVGMAVSKFADFDAAMSSVQAATHETTENMGLLREAAIEAGADTQYSATEAAGAIEELAKAGVQTTDILGGGLAGALDLAAAGQLEVGRAAEIAATAMTQFNLSGDQVGHIADVLAAGAGKAQGSVEDLSNALKYAGVPAGQLGLSLEETAGTLALFASRGIIGEQAGTSFRSMLMSLTAPSMIAQKALDEYNLTLFDANGQFVGLAGAAEELKTKLAPLTEEERQAALGRIFGNESLAAALTLYDAGSAGVQKWTAAVDDSGFAAETARLKTDNLRGDLERLGGSLDTALIQTGTVANDVLRGLVQRLGGLIDVYSNLPPAAQGATLAVGGVTAAVGLLGGGALIAIPKLVEFYDSLGRMGAAGSKAQGLLKGVGGVLAGPWGLALGAATIGLGIWAEKQFEASQRVSQLSATLDDQTGAITENTRTWVTNRLEQTGALAAAERLGISLETVTDAALGNADAQEAVADALERVREQTGPAGGQFAAMKSSVDDNRDASDLLYDSLGQLTGELDKSQESSRRMAEAMGADEEASTSNASAQEELATSMGAGADAAQDAASAVDDLSRALSELNGVGMAAIDAQIAWEASVDAATDALGKNGQTLDLNTDAGRTNMQALQGMASDANRLAEAVLRETGSEEQMRASLSASREALYQTALRFGMTESEAHAYVDRVLSVPAAKSTVISTPGLDDAMTKVALYRREIIELPDGHTFTLTTRYVTSGRPPANAGAAGVAVGSADGNILEFADGGTLPAIGDQQPQIQPNYGPAGIVWAETGAGPWEAFISGHPGKRARSVAIWEETGDRLGVNFTRFAHGGFATGGGLTAVAAQPAAPVFNFNVRTERTWTAAESLQLMARGMSMYYQ